MALSRRRLCALLGVTSLAGCSDALEDATEDDGAEPSDDEEPTETPDDEPESTDDDEEPPADSDESTDSDEGTDDPDSEQEAEEPDEEPDEEEPETDPEPDLREREAELPGLIRDSMTACRNRIATAVETYVSSADGSTDSEPPLASMSLLAEPDRGGTTRVLSTADDRLSGAVSRAGRQGIDDEPFQRLTELLNAEINTLDRAVRAHQTLARGYETTETVVRRADQRAYRTAESEHEDAGELLTTATERVGKTMTALEPIEAATETEREALETAGHVEIADRLDAGVEALAAYHDATENVPLAFENTDNAEDALLGDSERAFRLATVAADELEAIESEIEAAESPASVEPFEETLLERIRAKLDTAREVRAEAEERLD